MKKLLCLLVLIISVSGCATTTRKKKDNSLTKEYPNSYTAGTLILFGCGESIPNCTGDLIHHIQGEPIETLSKARRLLSKARGRIKVKASRIYNDGSYEEVTLARRDLGRRGENLMLLVGKSEPARFISAPAGNKTIDILQGPHMVTIAGEEIEHFYKIYINILNNSQKTAKFKFSSLTVLNSDNSSVTPLTPVEFGYWLASFNSSEKDILEGKRICLSDMTIDAGVTAKRNLFLMKKDINFPITIKISLEGNEFVAKLSR